MNSSFTLNSFSLHFSFSLFFLFFWKIFAKFFLTLLHIFPKGTFFYFFQNGVSCSNLPQIKYSGDLHHSNHVGDNPVTWITYLISKYMDSNTQNFSRNIIPCYCHLTFCGPWSVGTLLLSHLSSTSSGTQKKSTDKTCCTSCWERICNARALFPLRAFQRLRGRFH